YLASQSLEKAKQLGVYSPNPLLEKRASNSDIAETSKSLLKNIFFLDGQKRYTMSKGESPSEMFDHTDHCLFIELDEESIAAVNIRAYISLQDMLDDLYFALIYTKYRAYTYGSSWLLASKNDGVRQLIAPWSWLLPSGRNKSIHASILTWEGSSLDSY